MNKADREAKFVQELLNDGGKVKEYGVTYEHGHNCWYFLTGNNRIRYWSDMSRENLHKLGVSDDYCKRIV